MLACRIIGILQIRQKSKGKAERNDRLFAVPRRSHSELGLRDVGELSKPIREELEKFFVATDELEDSSDPATAKKFETMKHVRVSDCGSGGS